MSNNNEILKVDNVRKQYSNFTALKKINFAIKPGELVILLGPNGAGKSTLFSIISGLIPSDQGDCYIAGNSIEKKPVEALKNMGIVFQQSTIDLELSVKENLLFHSRLQGIKFKSIMKVINRELINFNLSKKLYNKVRTLSGGERRKVELIRSTLHKPKILLMDEPTVGLDPGSRKELLNKIITLKEKENLSVLWATHLVDEAEKADKIIILDKGNIVEMGTPNYIIKKSKKNDLSKAFFNIVKK